MRRRILPQRPCYQLRRLAACGGVARRQAVLLRPRRRRGVGARRRRRGSEVRDQRDGAERAVGGLHRAVQRRAAVLGLAGGRRRRHHAVRGSGERDGGAVGAAASCDRGRPGAQCDVPRGGGGDEQRGADGRRPGQLRGRQHAAHDGDGGGRLAGPSRAAAARQLVLGWVPAAERRPRSAALAGRCGRRVRRHREQSCGGRRQPFG